MSEEIIIYTTNDNGESVPLGSIQELLEAVRAPVILSLDEIKESADFWRLPVVQKIMTNLNPDSTQNPNNEYRQEIRLYHAKSRYFLSDRFGKRLRQGRVGAGDLELFKEFASMTREDHMAFILDGDKSF